jgi:two-component system cell cycle sensor histidine kinase/response regulator CckA
MDTDIPSQERGRVDTFMTDVAITRILIMEDDPGLAHLLEKRLQRQGYEVSLAANGEEGLRMARAAAYDLLIVDYNMPFLGGLDVIRTLASTNQLSPAIMVTGEGNEEVAVEAIKLGVADYIVKDVELKYLELIPTVVSQTLYRQQLIRERDQMQETVRESEERYRRLFESNPHPMWVFDRETHSFLAVNDAAVHHYGYSREEFLNMTLEDVGLPDEASRLKNTLSGAGAAPADSGVWKHRKKDGTIIDVEVISHPILFGQRHARFVLITDITARRKLEAELVKTQKLESLGTLAGGLAHDFNNLLTSILGNIYLAKMDARPGDGIYERLDAAERASERARGLTQQLLTFSRGGAPLKVKISIREAMRDIASFALHGSKSNCEFSISDDLWPVEADEGQLNQVISNLVMNADQAMPEGGTVTVSCRNRTLKADSGLPLPPGNYVMISVADRGIGIPTENLGKIFDPYFTTKQKGSGLGLATAYSIIKRHNGHIAVESAEGAGTVFDIYLPATDCALPAKPATAETTKPGAGAILFMDDDEMVRDIAGKVLVRLGYTVSYSRDGVEAIAAYEQARDEGRRFDAVIMDLTIPGGMGGKEAVKRLREIDPLVKAIVSSGYSDDPVMANYAEYGFSGVVSKPYTIHKLGETLRKVLAGS